MNLDELRSAQAKERRKDSLQHLRDAFYDDVATYVADLRAARDRRAEQVAKPFSDDDVRRLSDEVETAEEVAEALYERRVGKVVKLASFAAAEMSVDSDGMTTEERQLFDDLVDRIKQNKSSVLDVLSGEVPVGGADASAPVAADPDESPAPPAPDPDPADQSASGGSGGDEVTDALAGAMGGADDEIADAIDASADGAASQSDASPPTDEAGAEAGDGATTDGGPTAIPPEPAPPGAPGVDDADAPAESEAPSDPDESATSTVADGPDGADSIDSGPTDAADGTETDSEIGDRATVRITRDVGAIFGVDEREYDLASEDVVTLPVENATPLVERNAAERLD
ncbi:DNA replication complex subunit Gins51 [Halorubrum sp. HHNYT27]|uniref:DNA replication complex subunit Gins51 n=1 Tax=Halorubrum sp. HHNYT27 TaxID=3402275 RepID=UPI003EBBED4A